MSWEGEINCKLKRAQGWGFGKERGYALMGIFKKAALCLGGK